MKFLNLLNHCCRSLLVVSLAHYCLSIAIIAMTLPMRKSSSSLPEHLEKFLNIFSPSSIPEQVIAWILWMTNSSCNISAISSNFVPLYQRLRPLQSGVRQVSKMFNHRSVTPNFPALCTCRHRFQFHS